MINILKYREILAEGGGRWIAPHGIGFRLGKVWLGQNIWTMDLRCGHRGVRY